MVRLILLIMRQMPVLFYFDLNGICGLKRHVVLCHPCAGFLPIDNGADVLGETLRRQTSCSLMLLAQHANRCPTSPSHTPRPFLAKCQGELSAFSEEFMRRVILDALSGARQ